MNTSNTYLKKSMQVAYLLCLCMCSNFVFATDYYVNNASTVNDVYCTAIGNNANNGTSPATPKATLTNVLSTYGPSGSNVLTSGDRILVDAGDYNQTDKNLTLSVAGLEIIGAGANLTKFDNQSASADANMLFTITANNIHICCIMIKGYNKGTGGPSAVQITGATGVVFTNVLTDENKPGGGSAAILINGGSSVTFNGGGSSCNSVDPTVAGGGTNVEGRNNTVIFNDYSFARNSKSLQAGSGLYVLCDDGSTSVSVNRCIFADNVNATTTGGGGAFITGATVNFANCCFTNNQSGAVSSTNYGGAISVGRGAIVNVSNCTFTGNSVISSGRGGAIAINPISVTGGGDGSSTVNLTTCTFTSNTSARGNHLFTRTANTTRHGIFNVTECTFIEPASGVSVYSDAANCIVTLANSGNPSNTGTSGSVVFTNTTDPSTTASTSCPVLQGSCYGVILPVELLSFTGNCEGNKIKLNWATASELNNMNFKLFKVYENSNKRLIGIVDGEGNSATQTNYEWTDSNPEIGTNYYQLIQTDFDGTETDLGIISVMHECEAEVVTFFKNQSNELVLRHSLSRDENFRFEIIDLSGKVIVDKEISINKNENDLIIQLNNTINEGVYFIKISNHKTMFSQRIILSNI
jgi:hypothetical protein